MRTVVSLFAAIALGFSAAPLAAQEDGTPAQSLFEDWLAVFDGGDSQALRTFYAERLGDTNPVYPLEVFADSCGFDFVRSRHDDQGKFEALVVERCFPALQLVTVDADPDGEGARPTISMKPLSLSSDGALAYIDSAASRMAERGEFAGVLLVQRGGQEPWVHSYGFADRERHVPMDPNTPMLLASSGKMFTAIAILQLVEAGKVDLDAPLGRYITDYPNAEMVQVTIRQLLSHRGGTGDFGLLGRDDGANRERVHSIAEILALNGERPPEFPPGSRAEYSNYGFILLGGVVERASGQSYNDYIQQNIFDRAGMTHASFPLREEMDRAAFGWTTFYGEEDHLMPANDVLPWRGGPAGGGVASANDMSRFFAALRGGELVSPEMLSRATQLSDTPWYGLGFVVNPGQSWGHGGNGYGADIAAHYYIPKDTTFICMGARDMVCNRLIYAWYFRTFGPVE